jgi:type III secretory pathway component EscV
MDATMGRLTKHTDLLAAGAVVLVVIMMIIPIPPALLYKPF